MKCNIYIYIYIYISNSVKVIHRYGSDVMESIDACVLAAKASDV